MPPKKGGKQKEGPKKEKHVDKTFGMKNVSYKCIILSITRVYCVAELRSTNLNIEKQIYQGPTVYQTSRRTNE